MSSRTILLAFFLLSILHLLFILINPELTLFTKPLLIPALLWYYFIESKNPNKVMVFALVFCWIGDCLLMFTESGAIFFITGLGSFLTGHLLYIICFRNFTLPRQRPIPSFIYYISAIPVVFAGWLVNNLWDGLNDLKVPVVAYTLVIVVMFLHAIRRIHATNQNSFITLTSGAALFMISDSLLAYNMFGSPILYSGLMIMSTYLAAQFLIVKGILKH